MGGAEGFPDWSGSFPISDASWRSRILTRIGAWANFLGALIALAHYVTWWGRVQPGKDWILFQDPALVIGYDGSEEGGRGKYGLFVAISDAEVEIN